LRIEGYDRNRAKAYAEKWALSRNPAYYSFDGIGGDCTNFASQCLFAGSGVMNGTPVNGWFYYNLNSRSASWSGVEFLYRFLMNNTGTGPYGKEAAIRELLPGDLVQLGRADGTFYHTPIVLEIENGEIYVAAHTFDALWRPLSSYSYDRIRYLHIEGVRY
jgi:hypothetical protein